jgi:integrase
MPKAKERDGVYYRKDRGSWWVSYPGADGQRRREAVAAYTRPQAVAARAALMLKAERERVLGVREASDITTADLLARYKRHQKPRLRSTTFERLNGILETLRANLPERAKDISRKTVADYISARSESVAPGTVQKEITVLKHALKLAVEWELLNGNSAQGAKLPKLPEGRTRYLSPTELKAALEAAPDWMRAPLALAAFTGMRRGELLGLQWKDADMERRRAYLRETKNGSLRVVPLNELAFRVLASLPQGAPGDMVLPAVDGQRLSVYTERLFKKLGINDASFHSLRHTAASWLVMQGIDLYTVGQLLGHRTPRMTQRYAYLSPQYMAGAVGKLDSVFGEVMPSPAPGGLLEAAAQPDGLQYVTIASPDFEPAGFVPGKPLI